MRKYSHRGQTGYTGNERWLRKKNTFVPLYPNVLFNGNHRERAPVIAPGLPLAWVTSDILDVCTKFSIMNQGLLV